MDIGSWTTQAKIILGLYVFIVVVTFIMSLVRGSFGIGPFISLIVTLLFALLLSFDTNCLTHGDCNKWSWIRTVLYIIPLLVAIYFLFFPPSAAQLNSMMPAGTVATTPGIPPAIGGRA